MTTQVVKLPVDLARRLAVAADTIGKTHEETIIEAVRLFTRSVAATMPAPKRRKGKCGVRCASH